MPWGIGRKDDSAEDKAAGHDEREGKQGEEEAPKHKSRFLGFGKDSDDEDEKKKKKKPHKKKADGDDDDEGKPGAGGKKPHGKKAGHGSDDEEEDGAGKPGRRPHGKKPGHGAADDDDEEEPGRRPHGKKPGHGAADDDDEEEPGKPGRRPHGKKPGHGGADDDEEKEEPGKPGRRPHGKKPGHGGADDDDEEEPSKPGRRPHGKKPGHGGADDDDEEEEPGKPGRTPHGKKPGHGGADDDDEEEEPGKPGRRPHCKKPGHGATADDDDEEEPGKPGRRPHGKKPGHGPGAEDEDLSGGPAHCKPGHGTGKPGHHEPTPLHGGHGAGAAAGSIADQQQKLVEQQRKEAEEQRKRDEEERKRLQAIADDQPAQPAQPPQHGQGGGGGGGTVVHVEDGESIQKVINNATPGTTIVLGPGVYNQSLKSRCDGTKEHPITLKGPTSGEPAIVKGDEKSGTCVEINHDYWILEHFTIDAQQHKCKKKEDVHDAFKDKCLAIRGNRNHREIRAENGDRYPSSVEGCIVRNMKITNCGGEGIRVRYFVTHTQIYHNKISSTGCFDFLFDGDQGKKNGEGIYVGTSSNQWKKNLTGEQDICRWTHIYENYIDTHGNECVDVKEGTLDTIIEKNYCTGQKDEDSAGIDSRADKSIIRYNKVVGCKGAGVRLGGHKVDNVQYGIHCDVFCNKLIDNEYGGIKIMTEPHRICQNDISGPGSKYKIFRGEKASKFEETSECPFDVSPPSRDIEQEEWYHKLKDL